MFFSQKKGGKLESSWVLLSASSRGSCRLSCDAAKVNGKAPLHLGEAGVLRYLLWATPN